MLSGKRIILGISGGIAAYKSAELLRRLQKAGAEVRVCMSPAATHFIGTATLASLSKHNVAVSVFDEHTQNDWAAHIAWGEWADLMIIAPCTANTLAKIAHGLSDNMLTTTVLAARCPLLICPTMDGEMYEAPAVQANLRQIQDLGYHLLQPESGYLASGLIGKGRLPDYQQILHKAREILDKAESQLTSVESLPQILQHKKVVVTAGPTREHFDPVRFLSNPSSGKMGIAMAIAAQKLGAEVHLLHGPVDTATVPSSIHTESFVSAAELMQLMQKYHKEADLIIMAAAVSDWTPAVTLSQKAKKGQEVDFSVKPTQDILKWLGEHRQEGQCLIGFAMETENLLENARDKLLRKKVDWIFANALQQEKSSVFGADHNHILAISQQKQIAVEGSKETIAVQLLQRLFDQPHSEVGKP